MVIGGSSAMSSGPPESYRSLVPAPGEYDCNVKRRQDPDRPRGGRGGDDQMADAVLAHQLSSALQRFGGVDEYRVGASEFGGCRVQLPSSGRTDELDVRQDPPRLTGPGVRFRIDAFDDDRVYVVARHHVGDCADAHARRAADDPRTHGVRDRRVLKRRRDQSGCPGHTHFPSSSAQPQGPQAADVVVMRPCWGRCPAPRGPAAPRQAP